MQSDMYCCPGNTAMEVMETPEFNDLDGRVNTTVQRTCYCKVNIKVETLINSNKQTANTDNK